MMSSELPAGWLLVELNKIAGVFLGKTPAKHEYCSSSKHKIIKFRDIKSGSVDFYTNKDGFVIDHEPILRNLQELKKYDVLITSAAHSGENIGKKCAFIHTIPDDFRNVFFTGELLNIRSGLGYVLSRWIYFYFISQSGFKEIQNAVSGVHLTSGRAKLMQITIAPLSEQHRIIEKLDKLLTKVNACKERLDTIPVILKRFRQSVIAAACSGRLTADWRKKNANIEPAFEVFKKQLNKPNLDNILAVTDDELPEIPITWFYSHLQHLGELSRGKSRHRPRDDKKLFGGAYPFIQTGDVARSKGRITAHTQTYNEFGLSQSRLFPANTLCITIAANIADTAILTYPACFPDSIVGFLPYSKVFEVLFGMYFVRIIQKNLQMFAPATAQKNINLKILREVAVPVPPIQEQQEIVRRVEALFKKADAIEARYKKAKEQVDKLTQSILAKAFRGELVPQDPNDEPASVLLERIQAERAKKEAETKPKATKPKRIKGVAL